MTKKFLLTIFVSILYFTSFPQGAVITSRVMPCSNSSQGISYTMGQIFNYHSPNPATVPIVAEGIQQGYTTVAYDTLLLLSSEMSAYTPGENVLPTTSQEGYDEELHRQVYEMICTSDTVVVMTESGQPTKSVLLQEPSILPSGSVYPTGPVTLSLDRSNPYDYPVGETTRPTWTSMVAGQTRTCTPNVMINHYPCSALHGSVSDYDGYVYPIVRLGYYCWTGRNARSEHYADGTEINNVMTFPSEYATNVRDVVGTFGHLYDWESATNYNVETSPNRRQGICPNGWHIPNETEAMYLLSQFDPSELMSNDPIAAWIPQNGTDDYSFSFLPSGSYNAEQGRFEGIFVRAYYWTTEEDGTTIAHACQFGSACSTYEYIPANKMNGYSVRCVMNY